MTAIVLYCVNGAFKGCMCNSRIEDPEEVLIIVYFAVTDILFFSVQAGSMHGL